MRETQNDFFYTDSQKLIFYYFICQPYLYQYKLFLMGVTDGPICSDKNTLRIGPSVTSIISNLYWYKYGTNLKTKNHHFSQTIKYYS